MNPLLAEADGDPTKYLLGAISALAGVVIVLFWQLLKSKDEKLALAREFGKDYTADRVAAKEQQMAVTAEMKRVAEELRLALVERDQIVANGMDLLRKIDGTVNALLRERAT